MNRLVILGVCLVIGVEVTALTLHDRRFVILVSGVAVAVVLLNIRRYLGHDARPAADPATDELGESLRGWLSRTKTLIRWSDSTRSDWDRHLRPILARRFEMTTGQKQSKDPAAFRATGEMLFGPQLWAWVDPNNVAQTGREEPGPGRAALEEILQRLEQV
ncbi:hypothetical protein [Mycobacterium shimoidei]|uniref:Uncharacterized protein n=1 Tax=Mycobacterium shimoidei TaxID=29313 RepID=A0A1E3TEI0_MYCSH|nr:hypothetical protein [Mycobacterium shimoidei]MCV7260265.1 hypothetical protein [Mycobacterium shimoidei]ODR12847.1 hypothetical protein BHQ16_13235 [Mycobacterium shimoidei]ORW80733.1 hypothetical protein AWC26_10525 [Mycobacterium shimoidei]SRX96290.1 hypothetical protein MSP7336_04567 [Mycobacterium shimoidei]